MNISFDRHRAQLRCETILNCQTLDQWNVADFKNLQLNKSQASLLSSELREDAKDLYFKGLLSLFEALKSIEAKLFSWATVKFYYSLYYFLRCTMAVNGVALIRQKSLYYLKALDGESPVTKGGKKYSSDHSGTINFFKDLFSSDILLSQDIDTINAYDWIMNKREQVNYRERHFNEPNHSEFWGLIAEQINKGNLERILKEYILDKFVLCFQEEHAILAIPIKRALLTKERLDAENIDIGLIGERQKILLDLLPIKIPELVQLTIS
ncbi:MAG: hypothetical protein HOP30_07335 [Cyclobacteriaceae bacterium]|nr:hypothetical protein [Cyclobacteriaceae bacterium]